MIGNMFVALIIALVSVSASAAPMDGAVNTILKNSRVKNAHVGMYAVSVPQNKVIVDINKDLSLNPASCMKLLTSAVALKKLGPDYQFPTKFYLAGDVQDLWVKGYGDPSFVIEKLQETVALLIKAGLPVAIGDIYIDDTFFDGGHFPGQRKGVSRSYNAMTNAVALNHSAVTVEVSAGSKLGESVFVIVDAPGVTVKNLAKTGSAHSRRTIRISRTYTNGSETIKITGRMPLTGHPIKQFFSVINPAGHFGNTLKALLVEGGINVRGQIKYGIVPANARHIFEARSPRLSDILKNMNKNSNNFMAEQITKVIGAKFAGEPGSTEGGVAVFSQYLNSIGAHDFYIENGSGLSFKNRFSPYDLLLVMKDMYDNKSLRDVYFDSLSVAGFDGTLKKWDSAILKERLFAKTGSLNGVSTLAGLMPRTKDSVLFVLMLNGGHVDFMTGRRVSQKIAETLATGQ